VHLQSRKKYREVWRCKWLTLRLIRRHDIRLRNTNARWIATRELSNQEGPADTRQPASRVGFTKYLPAQSRPPNVNRVFKKNVMDVETRPASPRVGKSANEIQMLGESCLIDGARCAVGDQATVLASKEDS